MTSWIIWRFASALFAVSGALRLLSLAVLLTLGTSLPWIVGWMMPDIFTPLMIIALALLFFAQDALPRPSEILLVFLIGAALAFHQANLPVAFWTFPAFGLCALLGWRPRKPFFRGLFASGIGLTLGVVALVGMELLSGRFGLSSSGSVYLLARMLGDGTALSYLEQVCPQQHFAICPHLDELKSLNSRHPGELADYFLAGPLWSELGGFRAEEAEAAAIVGGTLLNYPVAEFRAAVHNGWRQLFCFRTGPELKPYSEPAFYVPFAIRAVFGPAIYDNYRQSKQMRNILEFDTINRIHLTVVIASSLLLIGFLVARGVKKQSRSFYATIFVTTLVAGNAFTLGVLSGPTERYQSRVIWLVPLLAGCIVLKRLPYPGHPKPPEVTNGPFL
jgi:hypothetical protein